jgi:ribosomal protein S20
MMIKLTESKKILLKRVLLIPNLIRHADSHNMTLKSAIKLADEYNEMLNDGDLESALEHLPSVTQSLLRYAEETALHKDELHIKNSLELKKKDHVISAMKSFNAFTKTVSNKKPTSPNKRTDGLSDAERKVIQSLK